MSHFIRGLRKGDLEYLVENLREADKLEVLAVAEDVTAALYDSISLSTSVFIIDVSGVPMGIFGTTYDSGVHSIWMLGTDEISEHPYKFVKYSKSLLRSLFALTGAETFTNFTHAKNGLHHKWLEWCGAKLSQVEIPYGPKGEPFLRFDIERSGYV